MAPKNTHKRILLNKNASGQVEYCEECDVIELALGAVSVRLHAQNLGLFSQLMQETVMNLETCHLEKSGFGMSGIVIEGLH